LDRVNFVLERVGLANSNKLMPSELSGGMKKRVGIARAIVNNSRYLFCDESTDYWPPAWKKWMAPRLPGGEWTDESVREGRRQIAAHLDVLEPYVTGRDWLVGAYSLADVCYAPLVLVLEHVGLAGEITSRAGVASWVDRLRVRPAIRAAMKLPGV
jgi:glutathione S-transferase